MLKRIPCPECGETIAVSLDDSPDQVECPRCHSRFRMRRKSPPVAEKAAGTIPDSPLAAFAIASEPAVPAAKRARKSRGRAIIYLPVTLAIVVAFAAWAFRPVPHNNPKGPALIQTVELEPALGKAASQVETDRQPIDLKLAPAGVRTVIFLRPREFWEKGGRGDEIRRCLPPLSRLLEQHMSATCLFPPIDIEELTIFLIYGALGEPPRVAQRVRLVKATSAAEVERRFGGARSKLGGHLVSRRNGLGLFIHDDSTFATGPEEMLEEFAASTRGQSPTDPGIEELLASSDCEKPFSILFRLDDVDRHAVGLFGSTYAPMARRVLAWLTPASTEAILLEVALHGRLEMRCVFRNRPEVPAAKLANIKRLQLDHLPVELVEGVRRLHPQAAGRRKLIARFPAMTEALSLGSTFGSDRRSVIWTACLPEQAAANLALAGYLATLEACRPQQRAEPKPVQIVKAKSVVERLQTAIDLDLRRSPLAEAFTTIGEEIDVKIDVDGDAIKVVGYTKNMPQTIAQKQKSAADAIRAILSQYPKMAIVIDEAEGRATVTTQEAAAAKGRKPFDFGPVMPRE